MPSFRTGTVTAILDQRDALQRVEVDGERAYVLTALIGPVEVGDTVVMNTTAVDLGLGTGGWHIVHWNLQRDRWSAPGRGHQMKLRYTSLQADTGSAEEPAGDGPAPTGVPVVVCGLHSQVGVVAVAARHAFPAATIAYVMTDSAALPMAMSELVLALRAAGMIDLTITAGQAFGGDLEAVNAASAIDLSARAGASVVIVGMGPGSLGTGSTLGFSGLEVGPIVDAAAALGHVPVAAVRYSSADERERHLGVSHHTRTALARFAHARAIVPIPRGEPAPDIGDHEVVEVDTPDVAALLEDSGIEITTMGRGPEPDPGFFRYAAAAGVYAAALAAARAGGGAALPPLAAAEPGPGAGAADERTPGEVVAAWASGSVATTPVSPPAPPVDSPAAEAGGGATPPEAEAPAVEPPAQDVSTAAAPAAEATAEEPPAGEPPAAEPAPEQPADEEHGVDVAELDDETAFDEPARHELAAEDPTVDRPARTADAAAPAAAGAPPGDDAVAPRAGRWRRLPRSTRNAIEWTVIIVGALVAAFVIKTFLVQAFYIPSASMEPTLEIRDRVLVNKLSYRLHDVHRGDLVVFERPPNAGTTDPRVKDLIKRVIGLPGERVETRSGEIYIDGRRLREPYLVDGVVSVIDRPVRVPSGHYFVMGDNRGQSNDSREFGAIPEDLIIGRAFVRVWPVTNIDLL